MRNSKSPAREIIGMLPITEYRIAEGIIETDILASASAISFPANED